MKIQLAGKKENSLVNGDGMRYTIFLSGCSHNCEGCHNKEMQNYSYGDSWDTNDLFEMVKSNIDYIDGITFSGGDPMMQPEAVYELAKRFKEELNINIWLYTGFLLEDIQSDLIRSKILNYLDVLVDGKFKKELLNSTTKRYVGSENQRIIYLNNGKIDKII